MHVSQSTPVFFRVQTKENAGGNVPLPARRRLLVEKVPKLSLSGRVCVFTSLLNMTGRRILGGCAIVYMTLELVFSV